MAADTVKPSAGRVKGNPPSSSRLAVCGQPYCFPGRFRLTLCLLPTRPVETPEQRQKRKQAEKDRAQAQVGPLTARSVGVGVQD